jgi:hypothetical protein
LQEAAISDIICTITPSHEPILEREWVIGGAHINAVGADASGKQELEAQILKDAVVVVDDIRQASSGGEINMPIKQGLYSADMVYGTLAEIVTGRKKGRAGIEEITVFDSTALLSRTSRWLNWSMRKPFRWNTAPLLTWWKNSRLNRWHILIPVAPVVILESASRG